LQKLPQLSQAEVGLAGFIYPEMAWLPGVKKDVGRQE
jgi:hypothetical protein